MNSIRIDVNNLSRDELLDLVGVQSEKLTNQLQGMIARDGRINQLEEALSQEKEKYKEIAFAFHHLKSSVSKAEVCGVPLHHLSYEMSKHFEVKTHDFVREFLAEAGMADWVAAANSRINFVEHRKEENNLFADIYANEIRGLSVKQNQGGDK